MNVHTPESREVREQRLREEYVEIAKKVAVLEHELIVKLIGADAIARAEEKIDIEIDAVLALTDEEYAKKVEQEDEELERFLSREINDLPMDEDQEALLKATGGVRKAAYPKEKLDGYHVTGVEAEALSFSKLDDDPVSRGIKTILFKVKSDKLEAKAFGKGFDFEPLDVPVTVAVEDAVAVAKQALARYEELSTLSREELERRIELNAEE